MVPQGRQRLARQPQQAPQHVRPGKRMYFLPSSPPHLPPPLQLRYLDLPGEGHAGCLHKRVRVGSGRTRSRHFANPAFCVQHSCQGSVTCSCVRRSAGAQAAPCCQQAAPGGDIGNVLRRRERLPGIGHRPHADLESLPAVALGNGQHDFHLHHEGAQEAPGRQRRQALQAGCQHGRGRWHPCNEPAGRRRAGRLGISSHRGACGVRVGVLGCACGCGCVVGERAQVGGQNAIMLDGCRQ